MKFRKKPVVIEAVLYTGKNDEEISDFAHDGWGSLFTGEKCIKTLEGDMHVSVGDWVIRGVKGEYYPCKPDIFEATYEPVEE